MAAADPIPPVEPLPESLRDRLARRKLGDPAGFRWTSLEFLEPDTTKFTGCVVTRTYTRGPRKGRPVYDGARRSVYVTDAEVAAEKQRYEAATGRCGECVGDGREFAGWNHAKGTRYRPCGRCCGTGAAARAAR